MPSKYAKHSVEMSVNLKSSMSPNKKEPRKNIDYDSENERVKEFMNLRKSEKILGNEILKNDNNNFNLLNYPIEIRSSLRNPYKI